MGSHVLVFFRSPPPGWWCSHVCDRVPLGFPIRPTSVPFVYPYGRAVRPKGHTQGRLVGFVPFVPSFQGLGFGGLDWNDGTRGTGRDPEGGGQEGLCRCGCGRHSDTMVSTTVDFADQEINEEDVWTVIDAYFMGEPKHARLDRRTKTGGTKPTRKLGFGSAQATTPCQAKNEEKTSHRIAGSIPR